MTKDNMTILIEGAHLGVRVIVLMAALFLGFLIMVAGANAANAATLKPSALLSDSILTLGDIFDGLSYDKAAYALGPAPRPGEDMILSAHTLMRIASAMDLPWRPASATDQIIIRREATLITRQHVEQELIAALRHQGGIEGRFNLHFTGGHAPELVLPAHSDTALNISALNIDPQSGRFSAMVTATTNPQVQSAVSGIIEHLIAVPVLKRTLREGDVIGDADINWIDVSARDLQHDLILHDEELIGMTPRRMALAGKPLRLNELQPPQLVSRGASVTIHYQDGPIHLSAKGKALQSGAKDDLVRVVNIASNRSIEAFVTGDHIVTVR